MASAVRCLLQHPVAAARFTAYGLGQRRSIAGNDAGQGRSSNRRVEVAIAARVWN
jgi:outer membrane protein OmpA-like peptidoglycan-associated protein